MASTEHAEQQVESGDKGSTESKLSNLVIEWPLEDRADLRTKVIDNHQHSVSNGREIMCDVDDILSTVAMHGNRVSEAFGEQMDTNETESEIGTSNLQLQRVSRPKISDDDTVALDNIVETSREVCIKKYSSLHVECGYMNSCGSEIPAFSMESEKSADNCTSTSNLAFSSQNAQLCVRDVASKMPALVDAAVQCNVNEDFSAEVSVKTENDCVLTDLQERVVCENTSCLTLNLPLEVIGACWFMRKDSETRLQALTSNNDEITVRLMKKNSRVTLSFEASSPSGKSFEQVFNGCRCHVESLLEPSKRSPSVEQTALSAISVSSSSESSRHDHSVSKPISSKAAVADNCSVVTVANVVSSRLRPRPASAINYEDSDEENPSGVAISEAVKSAYKNSLCAEEKGKEAEDFDSFEESDDMDGGDYDEKDLDGNGSESEDEDLSSRKQSEMATVNVNSRCKVSKKSSDIGNNIDDGEDCEWIASKDSECTKVSRSGIKLKVRIKSEPGINKEGALHAEENQHYVVSDETDSDTDPDDADEDMNWKETENQVVAKTRAQLQSTQLKRGHHKQTISNVQITNKVRRLKTKDGPKWEKKGNCPHCGVFYGNLSQHIGLYCPKNPNRQRAYHCCYCKFRCLDRAQLTEHKATHVLARDFKCEICDSSFFTRQRLVRHMRYVHLLGSNPVRIYTCDRCGKRFRYHSHYDRHLTIHSEEKSAQCDQCGKFFKNSHNVRNHQSRMHPGKPESFPFYCDKCGQGAHSLTGHRCIVPGEMHGSRRRRAPRSGPAGSIAPEGMVVIAEHASTPATSSSPTRSSPNVEEWHRSKRRPTNAPPGTNSDVVDCRAVAAIVPESSNQRSTGLLPPAVSRIESSIEHRHSSSLTSPSQHADQYPSHTPSAHLSFNPRPAAAQHMVDRQSSAVPSSYSHPNHQQLYHQQQTHHRHPTAAMRGVETSPYERHGAQSSAEHHAPAVAHQPLQHQSPYSNLLAVDPFLHAQLRAANMMYRMDF